MRKEQLGKTDAQVSAMCLGSMYFGSRIDESRSFEILDAYYEKGGRFVDTSNNYVYWLDGFTGSESEQTLGKWLKSRRNREDMFIATKCGVRPVRSNSNGTFDFEGISRTAIPKALEGSLKRLGVDYLDMYYIHVDWREDPLEETLETLNSLVTAGKVKHIACSNMMTWRMLKAKEISRRNEWVEFAGIQNWFSYLKPRSGADLWVQKFASDELLDYCATENDVTLLPYTSTLGGAYSWNSVYQKNHPALNTRFFSEENERRLTVIQQIAADRGVSPFRIMFAWMLSLPISIVPILGVSSISQLEDNLAALDMKLSNEELDRLNKASFNRHGYDEPAEVKLIP